MNLGQLFGQDKLRIWQLEDELAARNIRIVDTNTSAPIKTAVETIARTVNAPARGSRRGHDVGIGQRIHAALPQAPPGLMVCELAERLPDINRGSISAYLWMFKDIAHSGERGKFRYYRKAAA